MRLIAVLLLLVTSAIADEPTITTPDILFPMSPVLVEPQPTPNPQQVPTVITNIPSNSWYIIESRNQLFVFDVPSEYVTVKEYNVTTGTRTFLGKFVDGNGKDDEERTYPTREDSKFIYTVRAHKKGTTGLVTVPVGITDITQKTQLMITVMGEAPNPPPVPDDDDIVPIPTPPPTGIRVLILFEESANREQMNAIHSPLVEEWMITNCTKDENGGNGFRRWDKSSTLATGVPNETEIWKKLWEKVESKADELDSNMILVSTGTTVYRSPIVNTQGVLDFLNQIKEGK